MTFRRRDFLRGSALPALRVRRSFARTPDGLIPPHFVPVQPELFAAAGGVAILQEGPSESRCIGPSKLPGNRKAVQLAPFMCSHSTRFPLASSTGSTITTDPKLSRK